MNINDAYRLVDFIANKTVQNGFVSPDQFNNVAPIAQISVINKLLGNETEYQSGRPIPRYGFGIDQKIMEILRPLIVTPTPLPILYGLANYPADCLYVFAIQIPGAYQPAEPVQFDEAIYLTQSQIKPPTDKYPKHYSVAAYLYVLPATLNLTGTISYVRKPFTPFWNYSIVNQAPVYNPSGSQDFELSVLGHLRICAMILQMVGINLSLDRVAAYAMELEQSGA